MSITTKSVILILLLASFGYTAVPVMLPDNIGSTDWFASFVSTVLAMGIVFAIGFIYWIQDDIG